MNSKKWKKTVEGLLGIKNYNSEGDQEFDEDTLVQKTGYKPTDLEVKGSNIYGKIKKGLHKGEERRLAKNAKTGEEKREAYARIEGHAQHPEKYVEDFEDEELDDETLDEHIVKRSNGYYLLSKSTGKNLGGPYPNRSGAEKRERAVQFWKHARG